jgi:hypothetical protein
MALVRSLNVDAYGGNDCMLRLRNHLLSLGWTFTKGGTGSDIFQTYPPDPDYLGQVVGPGYTDTDFSGWGVGDSSWWSGRIPPGVGYGSNNTRGSGASLIAQSFGRASCWYALESPTGHGLFVARSQYWGSADDDWVVAYSPDGWTHLPGAAYDSADPPYSPTGREKILHGWAGGWGAAGLLPQWPPGGGPNIKLHLLGDDAPEGPSGERGWIMLPMQATNALAAILALDPFVDALGGQLANPDAYSVICHPGASLSPNGFGSPSQWFTRWGTPAGESSWDRCYYGYWQSTTTTEAPGNGRASSYDGKERPLPIPIHVDAWGHIGAVSKWLRWASVSHDYPNKATSPVPWLFLDDAMVYGWDPAVTPASI